MLNWQIFAILNGHKKTQNTTSGGLCPGSKLCENGPEIVEKKYTVAFSIPDVTPRKNKKVRSVRDTKCGVFRYKDVVISSLVVKLWR
jgi:hypothetical protein